MSNKQTRDDADRFFEFDVDYANRIIYMGSVEYEDGSEYGATSVITERFIKGMLILESKADTPITVVMNNPGGDWYHGMAVYDAIKCSPCFVTIKVYGHAMSMGSIILQAGDKRLLAPHTGVLLHYGTAGSCPVHVKDFLNLADEEKRVNGLMERIYLAKIKEKFPKFKKADLEELIKYDKYMDAKKTVKQGLADGIIGVDHD